MGNRCFFLFLKKTFFAETACARTVCGVHFLFFSKVRSRKKKKKKKRPGGVFPQCLLTDANLLPICSSSPPHFTPSFPSCACLIRLMLDQLLHDFFVCICALTVPVALQVAPAMQTSLDQNGDKSNGKAEVRRTTSLFLLTLTLS